MTGTVLQEFLDAAAAVDARAPVQQAFSLEEIVEAHRVMEAGRGAGKLVVTT